MNNPARSLRKGSVLHGFFTNGGSLIILNSSRRLSLLVLLALSSACGPADSQHHFSPFLSAPSPSIVGWGNTPTAFGAGLKRAEHALLIHPRIRGLLDSGDIALRPVLHNSSPALETFRYQASYQGVDIVGAQALAHIDSQEVEIEDNVPELHLNASPSIQAKDALNIARSHAPEGALSEPRLMIFAPIDEEMLSYLVTVVSDDVMSNRDLWIDAHTGELIANIPHTLHIADNLVLIATEESQEFSPEGALVSINIKKMPTVLKNGGAASTTVFADAAAWKASQNAEATLKYYSERFKRESYDGKGSEIKSIVHLGKNFANALWHQGNKFMAYGDGDGKETTSFTEALDVAGHEMTHGVIGSSAQLMGIGEAGAVNEALADFFGKMIDNTDEWTMGTQLYINNTDRKGIRDIQNPSRLTFHYLPPDQVGEKEPKFTEGPYPDHYSKKYISALPCQPVNDICRVHGNSTIFSHGAYLVFEAIGKEKAEQVMYLAMTQFMTPISGLRSAARAAGKACDKLYDAETCGKVRDAFGKVGL